MNIGLGLSVEGIHKSLLMDFGIAEGIETGRIHPCKYTYEIGFRIELDFNCFEGVSI